MLRSLSALLTDGERANDAPPSRGVFVSGATNLTRPERYDVGRPRLRSASVQAVRAGEPGDVPNVTPFPERAADPTARPAEFYYALSHASCDEGRDVAGRGPLASRTPASKRLALIQEVPKRPKKDWLHVRSFMPRRAQGASPNNCHEQRKRPATFRQLAFTNDTVVET